MEKACSGSQSGWQLWAGPWLPSSSCWAWVPNKAMLGLSATSTETEPEGVCTEADRAGAQTMSAPSLLPSPGGDLTPCENNTPRFLFR